ncbi:MAG: GNAT family N-acetyltransferase [Hydrogenophaga sp.]|uniref:GNAT family N-acetyltransferase n=1 Tax=Hydrogenophaga sp. TaxID=1904254 RepID=UPI001D6BED3A|nr:GNAT family N-acetyltransferase [Hydrogenophaga sp.]MBX3610803.1 GNAT family N-acetyltransferase [Hydrogenophaga sp.]
MHPLDRPVWASLSTSLAPLSEGGDLARRLLPTVNLFGASRDDTPESLAALAALVAPGEQLYLAQVGTIAVPPGLTLLKSATGVQMLAEQDLRPLVGRGDDTAAWEVLQDADAADMLALARLTEPGPFLARTHTMGRFLGVRTPNGLAAMAGERLRQPGFTEVSGVCTHPDHRGRGLARRLSATVAAVIQARGEQPYLHAWSTNRAAISLYKQLGFRVRTEIQVAVLGRPG